MKPSLNIDYQDPKYNLLSKIFKFIDSKTAMKIYGRNNIKDVKKFSLFIKLIFISLYYDYTISDLIYEIKGNERWIKFLNIESDFPSSDQVYEYMARLDSVQVVNVVNSLLKLFNNNRKRRKTLIVDATSIECDINHIKRYISKEKLEKLNLKWGYSTTKKYYIGFKLTMVLDNDTMAPVSMLLHSGAKSDVKIYSEILEELKRRHIIKKGDIILFDRGYYSKENYNIGILQYNIVPLIFPRKNLNFKKLKDSFSYSLDVFFEKTKVKKLKREINRLFNRLSNMLENWKEYKPIRGLIEDFFKVTKSAFNLDKLHKYTHESVLKTTYLCILLTTIAVNNGYSTKTGMQQLSEGKLNQKPIKKTKKTDTDNKDEKNKNSSGLYSKQKEETHNTKKEHRRTGQQYLKI